MMWATAPYLHDGSAQTLDEVFSVAGGAMLQAEGGTLLDGAVLVDQYIELNNDDTVHGRAYVALDVEGARVVFGGVDGGGGGLGDLELRYSTGWSDTLDLVVNGAVVASPFVPVTDNDPPWRQTYWGRIRSENVELLAGPVNTIEVVVTDPFASTAFDDLLVTTADERALAQPHRQVLALPSGDRDALLAYLRQLDGNEDGLADPPFFADGFESGDTSAWSVVAP